MNASAVLENIKNENMRPIPYWGIRRMFCFENRVFRIHIRKEGEWLVKKDGERKGWNSLTDKGIYFIY